jgi:hypothetical protein
MALGHYPDVPLAEARKRLASGVDPMAEHKAEKTAKREAEANSFETVAALWFEHWRADKSPRHAKYYGAAASVGSYLS